MTKLLSLVLLTLVLPNYDKYREGNRMNVPRRRFSVVAAAIFDDFRRRNKQPPHHFCTCRRTKCHSVSCQHHSIPGARQSDNLSRCKTLGSFFSVDCCDPHTPAFRWIPPGHFVVTHASLGTPSRLTLELAPTAEGWVLKGCRGVC